MNKVLKLKIIERYGSQAEFVAQNINVIDEASISKFIHGRRIPTEKKKRLIAAALNVKVDEIFSELNMACGG
jgi:transcriptional regulator with XRE-family HTH domain